MQFFCFVLGIIKKCTTSVLNDSYLVHVHCDFDHTMIKGILVILLYNDLHPVNKRGEVVSLNTTKLSKQSVIVHGKSSGLHYITVHPILKKSHMLGSRIPFGQIIYIPEPSTAPTGKSEIGRFLQMCHNK